MKNADSFNALRTRLRLSRPEVAAATGYSLGYVNRWGHAGATAVDPPDNAIATLAGLVWQRALADLAEFGGQVQ